MGRDVTIDKARALPAGPPLGSLMAAPREAPVPLELPAHLRAPVVLSVCGVVFAIAFYIQARTSPGIATYFPSGGAYPPHLKVLVLVLAALCVVIARRWPAARDHVIASVGIGFALYVTSWQLVTAMLGVAILVHQLARRVPGGFALVATAALLLVLFARFVPRTASDAINGGLAWASLRICYYAYESRAIKRTRRSIWSLLAFSPFTVMLWPGDPPMLSYITYTTPRPRVFLDMLGGRALYRAALKLHLFLLYDLVLKPALAGDDPFRTVVQFFCPYVVLYLTLSASADLCTGFSNLAGYYAPDAFNWPFLSMTPIHLWMRWNVHVLGFLRQTVILPIARTRRSLGAMVVGGLLVSVLLHVYARGPYWYPIDVRALVVNIVVTQLFFLSAVPFYQRVERWTRPAQIAATLVTQIALAAYFKYAPGF